MKYFEGIDIWFWATVVGAILVKVLLSPTRSILRICTTIAVGVFCAAVFTSPVLAWFELPRETFGYAVAGLLAVTGEELVRRVIGFSNDPASLIDLLNIWKKRT